MQTTDQNPEFVYKSKTNKSQFAQMGIDHPVVWALDPMEHDLKRLRPLAKAINLWRKAYASSVLPVSVISPSEINWPMEIASPISDKLVHIASGFLKPAVQKLFSDEKAEPRILLQKTDSHRQAVRQLLKYAKKNKAQLIAVSTHGRRGFNRLMLGSFAELLLTHSDIPILTVNPNTEVPSEVATIAFVTDFSASSKRALKKVTRWAQKFHAKLKIIHIYTIPADLFPGILDGRTVTETTIREAWWKAEQEQRKEGEKWAALARADGANAEFCFIKRAGNVGEVIVDVTVSESADLIVLTAAHGLIAMAFLGNLVRTILSTAKRPVILLRSR